MKKMIEQVMDMSLYAKPDIGTVLKTATQTADPTRQFLLCLQQLGELSQGEAQQNISDLMPLPTMGAVVPSEEDYELSCVLLAQQAVFLQPVPTLLEESAEIPVQEMQRISSVSDHIAMAEPLMPNTAKADIPVQTTMEPTIKAPMDATQNVLPEQVHSKVTTVQDTFEKAPVTSVTVPASNEEKPLQHVPQTQKPTDSSRPEAQLYAGGEERLFDTGETVLVQVSDSTYTAPSLSSQLKQSVLYSLNNGENKLVVQLEPANLGRISIEISRDAEGKVNILMTAQSTETKSLIEKHMPSLETALRDRGYEPQLELRSMPEQTHQQYDLLRENGGQQQPRRDREQKQEEKHNADDFVQRLRLGLTELREVS